MWKKNFVSLYECMYMSKHKHTLILFLFFSNNPAIPAPSIEFASLCLRNALLLLPEDPLQSDISEEQNDSW